MRFVIIDCLRLRVDCSFVSVEIYIFCEMEETCCSSAMKTSTSQAELDKALEEEEIEEHSLRELLKVQVDDDQISLDGLIDDFTTRYHQNTTKVEELQILLGQDTLTTEPCNDDEQIENVEASGSQHSPETGDVNAEISATVQGDAEKKDGEPGKNNTSHEEPSSLDIKSSSDQNDIPEILVQGDAEKKNGEPGKNDTSQEKTSSLDKTSSCANVDNSANETVKASAVDDSGPIIKQLEDAVSDTIAIIGEPSDVEVQKDGSLLTSGEQTCSGALSSEGVQTFRPEASSTRALSTGAPPGCEVPHPECLGAQSVLLPSEQILTDDSHLPSTSIEESSGDSSKEINIVAEHNVEDNQIIATGSSTPKEETSAEPSKRGNVKYKKDSKDDGKEKRKKSSKKDAKVKVEKKSGKNKEKTRKKEKRSKDEKSERKTKAKKSRGFISLFCCCFRKQENDDLNEETKESTVEETKDQLKDNSGSKVVTTELNN